MSKSFWNSFLHHKKNLSFFLSWLSASPPSLPIFKANQSSFDSLLITHWRYLSTSTSESWKIRSLLNMCAGWYVLETFTSEWGLVCGWFKLSEDNNICTKYIYKSLEEPENITESPKYDLDSGLMGLLTKDACRVETTLYVHTYSLFFTSTISKQGASCLLVCLFKNYRWFLLAFRMADENLFLLFGDFASYLLVYLKIRY